MKSDLVKKSNQLYKDVKEFSDRTKNRIEKIQDRISQDDISAIKAQNIKLPFDLAHEIVQFSKKQNSSVEKIVEDAIKSYLEEYKHHQ